MNEEMEKLIKLLSQASQEIGEERTIERISDGVIALDGKLIEVKKGSIEENGIIKDLTSFELRQFSCGHLSRGRKNFGGICSSKKHNYRKLPVLNRNIGPLTPFVCCDRCIKRCIRCKRLFCIYCITTVHSLPGVCFCKRCAFWRGLGDIFLRR
ncbi:MAG: hypothetical protein Q8N76_06590 [Candidatus Omnitrophota bacterium]|nr:hypothetical protein [Candidatus Omnitrophota bacterium]